MELEKVVADLVQKVERRFYGKYRGFVVNNDGPETTWSRHAPGPQRVGS